MKEYTVRVHSDGTREWYLNDKLHREDGPAFECSNGGKIWYLNGKIHREDGPAAEWMSGGKEWYLNGERHREDGPASKWANENKLWFLNGIKLTEEEFLQRQNRCDGKIVEIDGKKYELKLVKEERQ
jgi:hypothetical protein